MARALEEMTDPRLVALGLAPEPTAPPPAEAVVVPPSDPVPPSGPQPSSPVDPAPAAPAVAWEPPAIPARPPEPAPLPHSEVLLRAEVIVGRERAELALERLGLRIRGASVLAVPWDRVTSIDVRRGRIRIRARDTDIHMTVAMDGVAEPALAAPFAQVIRDVSTGRLERDGTAAVQLQNAMDRVRASFRESDDAALPLILGAAGAFVTVLVVLALPSLLFVALRPPVTRDAFLLATVLSSFDPRVIVAALAAGAAAISLVARVTLGEYVDPWARGTLRGWRADDPPLAQRGRRLLAHIVQRPLLASGVFVAALIVALPSARAQATVDARGVHIFGAIAFDDREAPWADVSEVLRIPAPPAAHPDGYAVAILSNDGHVVSTRLLRLQNGTDAYFFDLVNRWRGTPAP